MRTIDIKSQLDGKTHQATFEPVRSARYGTLGWATVEDDGATFRFPTIIMDNDSRTGYTVYTVTDWQAPQAASAT